MQEKIMKRGMMDRKILAYAFYDKSSAIKIIDRVDKKLLKPPYDGIIQVIYECIKKYNEIPTLLMLERCNSWNPEFLDIIREILEIKNQEDFNISNFVLNLEDLKERYKKNKLIEVGKKVFKENWDGSKFIDINGAVKQLKRSVGDLETVDAKKTFKEGTIAETAEESKEGYLRRKENPELARGIITGIREFDRITNGIQKSELILIGGESSSGKSALAMNMGINAWLGSNYIPRTLNEQIREFATDGVNVILFTIEMPFDPFRRRFDACTSEVSLYGIRDGNLSIQDEEKYFACLKFQQLYSKNFYIVDIPRGCTISQIESKYLELMYDFIPELIIIDYISLMKVDDIDSESDWLSLGRVAEQVHEFCRTYNIPCITPVQLNRPKSGSDNLPDQHRVGRSLMLPQNANIMLNIQSRQNEETHPDMVVNIAKMRDGEKGSFLLYKRFDMMKLRNDPDQIWLP